MKAPLKLCRAIAKAKKACCCSASFLNIFPYLHKGEKCFRKDRKCWERLWDSVKVLSQTQRANCVMPQGVKDTVSPFEMLTL